MTPLSKTEVNSKYFRCVSNNLRVWYWRKKKKHQFVLFLIISISTCLLWCYISNRPVLRNINILHFQQMNTVSCWLSDCNVIYYLGYSIEQIWKETLSDWAGTRPLTQELQLKPVQHWYSSNSIKNEKISVSLRACNHVSTWCRLSLKHKGNSIATSSVSSMEIQFSFLFCIDGF